ncbi:MAG: HAD-IA family hydrolase [Silicimonas sp.]|nr:HAD-IA family hydrolase [Silicimonas sp.]
MKTVIFDLDGTLADTSGDLIAAANASFRGLGLGDLLDDQADMLTAFHGGRAMLRLGFSRSGATFGDAEVDRAYPDFLTHYEENIDVKTRLYPGCIEAVEGLLAEGVKIGVCTNKPEYLAEELLRRLGVRDHFGSLIGADTLPVRKPDPRPFAEAVARVAGDQARSVLIGDTETDLKTARAAGVPVVLVSFGPEGEGVQRLKPDALLPDYASLGRVVDDLIGQTP